MRLFSIKRLVNKDAYFNLLTSNRLQASYPINTYDFPYIIFIFVKKNSMVFNFFNTAPILISETVQKLSRAGKEDLFEAIREERKNHSFEGSSSNGHIKVMRVGSYQKKG